jgi:polyphosphate glucokinase
MLARMAAQAAASQDDPPIPPPGTRLEGLALGIDVGGTGVKAALVDLATAELASQRIREKTPQPSDPESVVAVIRSVVDRVLDGRDIAEFLPVGCGLPGVVKNGRLTTAANIDPGWVGWPAQEKIGEAIGRPAMIINDADAAGLAEMAYGAGEGVPGTVLLLTLGTGIGSALFIDGALVPNTELGHVEFRGKDAEQRLSGAARERRRLGWKVWAKEFDYYLSRLELYLQPDLFILGGGVSKEWARFGKYLNRPTPIRTAAYLNASGIIGAAYAAAAAWRRHRALAWEPGAEESPALAVEFAADPYGQIESVSPAAGDNAADVDGPGRNELGHMTEAQAGAEATRAEEPMTAEPPSRDPASRSKRKGRASAKAGGKARARSG